VGQFNCSQSSLTSQAALAALRDLPNTNPALYLELSGSTKLPEEIDKGDLFSANDEAFDYNDESDVTVNVVVDHVMSGGVGAPAGFALTDDGSLIRNGAAEDSEVNVIDDLPLAVRPRRGEKKNTLYHADIWEEYK
jgi:hypothetical protein